MGKGYSVSDTVQDTAILKRAFKMVETDRQFSDRRSEWRTSRDCEGWGSCMTTCRLSRRDPTFGPFVHKIKASWQAHVEAEDWPKFLSR